MIHATKLTLLRAGIWIYFLVQVAETQRTCRTPNGETAHCISIYECNILYRALSNRSPEQIQFLRESQCGYERDPLVCCGSTANYRSHTTLPPRRRTTHRPGNHHHGNRLPGRDICGFQGADRILDGEVTQIDEFPWMALLQYKPKTGPLDFACGGSLISVKFVLTAAHCVTGPILEQVGKLHRVRLGEWNTEKDVDCVNEDGYQDCNDPPVDMEVEDSFAHPDYDVNSKNRYHDIALVKMKTTVRFTDFIKPICLPDGTSSTRPGQRLVVAGWGRTEHASSSPIKLKLRVPVVASSQCSQRFRQANVNLRSSQICAGGEEGRDSCSGDSGGPLMNTFRNDSGQWYIEGVVSFGAKCGSAGWPGIYTSVASYADWIKENVRD